VTFARAGLFGRPRVPTGSHSSKVAVIDPSGERPQVRRTAVIAAAVVAAMAAGGTSVYLVARRQQPVQPPVVVAPPLEAPVNPPPVVTQIETPVVTPIDVRPPREEHEREHPRGKHHPTEKVKAPPPKEIPPDPVAVVKKSRESVEAKFKTVKHEYDAFKGEYGPRLEGQWNAITKQITFGSGETKYEKLDGMLDSLRKEMSRVRDGG
jgi:hypothetical protein